MTAIPRESKNEVNALERTTTYSYASRQMDGHPEHRVINKFGSRIVMTQFDWADLIIDDITPGEFEDWLSPWFSLINGDVAPAFLTKFGSWFLHRPSGQVDMLDVLSGTITRANPTYDDFVREVNDQWWQELFRHSELVLQLHNAGKIPGAGRAAR